MLMREIVFEDGTRQTNYVHSLVRDEEIPESDFSATFGEGSHACFCSIESHSNQSCPAAPLLHCLACKRCLVPTFHSARFFAMRQRRKVRPWHGKCLASLVEPLGTADCVLEPYGSEAWADIRCGRHVLVLYDDVYYLGFIAWHRKNVEKAWHSKLSRHSAQLLHSVHVALFKLHLKANSSLWNVTALPCPCTLISPCSNQDTLECTRFESCMMSCLICPADCSGQGLRGLGPLDSMHGTCPADSSFTLESLAIVSSRV